MAAIAIVLELDDAAPMKTFTTLRELPGVLDIHMGHARSVAELRRFLRNEATAAAAPAAAPANAPGSPPVSGGSNRDIVLRFIAAHPGERWGQLKARFAETGRNAASAGAAINDTLAKGDARKNAADGYVLTAQGKRTVASLSTAVSPHINNVESYGVNQDLVIALLRAAGGKIEMKQLLDAAEAQGHDRQHIVAATGRLKEKKIVTTPAKTKGLSGRYIVQLREP